MVYYWRQAVVNFIESNPATCLDNDCPLCRKYLQELNENPEKFIKNKGGYIKHISSCIHALKKISLSQQDLVESYCLEQTMGDDNTRTLSKKTIDKLLIFLSANKNKNYLEQPNYIDMQYANDFLASSIVVQNPTLFPSSAGIYVVRFLNNKAWNVLYVGISINLRNRWFQHHRANEIETLAKVGLQIEYRYLAETLLMKFDKPLEEIEAILIDAFKPKFNNTPILSLVS